MLTMDSIFKKLLNTGIGAASKITRFSAEMINDLVQSGKISEEEGKSIMNDLEREGQLQQQEIEKEFKMYLERMIKDMDIPSKEDFNNLEARVEILERSMPGAIRID
jgi:polyhydroxyalkanoate synthesis regulator phasin